METLKFLGPDCFQNINDKPDEVFHVDSPDVGGNAQVVKIGINPAYFCQFISFSNFKLEGDGHVKVFYLPYHGYAPAYMSDNGSCKFKPENYLLEGGLNSWFKPNSFGGACGYIVLLGVD